MTDALSICMVHPDLQPYIGPIKAISQGLKPLNATSLDEARGRDARFARPLLPDVHYHQKTIPGAAGQPDVSVYVINAKPGTTRPAILHMHGGGLVMGKAASSIGYLQECCKALDCVAVSVDYRLAPESNYASSIEDNYAALQWVHDNADDLGADQSRIAVMGESAGGTHAALLAIAARDRGKIPICFQSLTYPMLDDRTGSTRHLPPHVGTLIWTPANNRFGWESFLGAAPGGVTVLEGAVPARVKILEGLPPAFIGVGTLDLFVDEDKEYAARLQAAGVATELLIVPGAFHAFDGIAPQATVVQQFNAARLGSLRRALALETE